jgi:two-component system response regulator
VGFTIVLADDDEDDRLLILDAIREARITSDVHVVRDGIELLAFLRGDGTTPPPAPQLILLDLNMPRMDGRQALAEIRADPRLRPIPVVILTTSKAQEDLLRTYELGANSYIPKPVTFMGLVEAMKVIGRYWFEIVELPGRETS